MANITEHFFDSKEQMTQALAQSLESRLTSALSDQGQASLMVSGGSSPEGAYKYLSNLDIQWQNVNVAMVDERWVDVDHEKSNEAFIKRTLLQNKAQKANFICMKNSAQSAELGQAQCQAAYEKVAQPFDVTILGMGPDGHTASLFPHAQGLENGLESDQLVCAINAIESEVTGSITERMTLTLNAISRSKVVKLLISGDTKLAVYREALEGDDVHAMPLRAVLNHPDIELEVYWAP